MTAVTTRLALADPSLFPRSGSEVCEPALAMLRSEPESGAVTTTVRLTVDPLARVANAGQVTTPAASVPPLLAETKVTPAGRVSRTTTAAAVDGPLLVTAMV